MSAVGQRPVAKAPPSKVPPAKQAGGSPTREQSPAKKGLPSSKSPQPGKAPPAGIAAPPAKKAVAQPSSAQVGGGTPTPRPKVMEARPSGSGEGKGEVVEQMPPSTPPSSVPSQKPFSAAPSATAPSERASSGASPPSSVASGKKVSAARQPTGSESWEAPKATTMRLLVAADDELIPDWRERRIAAICPMNMPIKDYLEKAIKAKMKWENMDNVVATTAVGKDLSAIRSTGDVLEVALTPHQLRMEPDAIQWVWLRKRHDYDAPPRTAAELQKERLIHFYQYYEPAKVKEAEAILENFSGQEELLFVKLTSQYGPEPTLEQVRRRMMLDASSIAGSSASGAGPGTKAVSSKGGGSGRPQLAGDFATIANSLNLASVLSRSSDTLLMIVYLKKWLVWGRAKRDSRRVCAFMSGNMDKHIRRSYYVKWRSFCTTKRMKRELQVTSQQAYKSESLVGDLATENMFLKGEVKKLRAQVEVLDQANAKRLESLFSSSEAAIGQIQLLTRENQQKEELINKLEAKLMNVGNLMLQANEEKENALLEVQNDRLRLEDEVSMLRSKVDLLESGMHAAQREVKELQDKPPPKVETFAEYQRLRHECDVHNRNHERLRARIEELEREKAALKEAITKQQAVVSKLQREVQQLQENGANTGGASAFGSVRQDGDRGVTTFNDEVPPPPPPPADDDQTGEHSRPLSPARRTMTVSFVGGGKGGGSVPNTSIGMSRQTSGMVNPLLSVASGGESVHYRDANPPASHSPSRGERVNMSLEGFFDREERVAREKMKLYMNRHLQPRYNAAAPSGTSNLSSMGTHYHVQAPPLVGPTSEEPVPDPVARYGMEAILMQEKMEMQAVAARPRAEPRHTMYGVGEARGSRTDMKKSLFNFAPTSL